MDPVEKISRQVQARVDNLGDEIIGFAEQKRMIAGNRDMSEAEKADRIEAIRNSLRQNMETVFGQGEGSIQADIQRLLVSGPGRAADEEKTRKAIDIWLEELPGLRGFLQYCAEMIESHPGEVSREIRRSQKCLTEAAVVMEKISSRVECEAC